MDAVADIKARLPIDELVRDYVQLTRKGRNFVGLCPFHQDKNPSFLVSPDKGICYCFPCQKGGDIFSFYQQVENVDFPTALKDLAAKTGVQLPDKPLDPIHKDEKERMRECLEVASAFYVATLSSSPSTLEYLSSRGVNAEESAAFRLGLAPDSFTATYDHLLKAGFSRKEIVQCGLGVQKELNDDRVYDRFRNRLMFPIFDVQGHIIGFGGRTMGNDDAKYMNSAETPLYHKSSVLFGINRAKDAMRKTKRVVVVEGYFDVLACHRAGCLEVVATCGTALTEDHARIFKRSVDTVVLCLDQDTAGRDAAERGFAVCTKEGLRVEVVVLPTKDPADLAITSLDELKQLLNEGAKPYLDMVMGDVALLDHASPKARMEALEKLLPLLSVIPSAVERAHYIRAAAQALGTSEGALEQDLRSFSSRNRSTVSPAKQHLNMSPYSAVELTLGLFLMHKEQRPLVAKLLRPEDAELSRVYDALLADHPLPEDLQERTNVLLLYCENQGFGDWNSSTAEREIRTNIEHANREFVRKKQAELTKKMLDARQAGDSALEHALSGEYRELIRQAEAARKP